MCEKTNGYCILQIAAGLCRNEVSDKTIHDSLLQFGINLFVTTFYLLENPNYLQFTIS